MKFYSKVKKGVEIIGNVKSVDGILDVEDESLCQQLKSLGYEAIQEENEVQEVIDVEKVIPLIEVPVVGTVSAEAPKKSKKNK